MPEDRQVVGHANEDGHSAPNGLAIIEYGIGGGKIALEAVFFFCWLPFFNGLTSASDMATMGGTEN